MPPVRPFSFMPSVRTGRLNALSPTAAYFVFPGIPPPTLPSGPVALSANWRGMTIVSDGSWEPDPMVRPGTGGPSLAGTFGELDATGHAEAWFTPPPELLPFLAGTRIEWSGIVFTPTGRIALPLAGFDVLP